MNARDKRLGLKKPAPRGTLTEQNAFYRMLDQRNVEEAKMAYHDLNHRPESFDQAVVASRFVLGQWYLTRPL